MSSAIAPSEDPEHQNPEPLWPVQPEQGSDAHGQSCCLLELNSNCQHKQKASPAGIHHETQLCERAGTKENRL